MRGIWAVAVNTIRQAIRLKIAAAFIILLLVLLPVMGIKMTGDGTLKGHVQTFVSYGLSLTTLLLALLTIFAATYALTSDIKDKQVYTVLTKPVRRFQFILGKLFGIVLLDAALLFLFAAVIYSITVLLPDFSKASAEQKEQVNNEFYTARISVLPPAPDIADELQKTYETLLKNGEVPQGVDERPAIKRNYLNELARRIDLRKRAAAVGEEIVWEFENIKLNDPNQPLFIKFKYEVSVNPVGEQLYSKWIVGDVRQLRLGGPVVTPIYSVDRKDLIRTSREFQVPGDCVAGDGYVAVAFMNVPLNDTVVIFPIKDGIELLYKADSFAANFARAVLLVFIRLVFLAALSVFAGSFLSFPVAILFCLAIFTMGNMSGFVNESFEFLGDNVNKIYYYSLKPIINLLPEFDQNNPVQFLLPAKIISWSLLVKQSFVTIGLKALPLTLLSLIIFAYREIAKVIV
jgi:hypothetical protein